MKNTTKVISLKAALLVFAFIGHLSAVTPGLAEPVYGTAILRTWVPPDYPKKAREEGLTGTVTLRLTIDEKGAVTSSRVLDASDPMFVGPAESAVKAWTFSPALDNGKPVTCSMDVPVGFSPELFARKGPAASRPPPDQMPVPAAVTEAKLESSPDVDYPDSLFDRKLSGLAHYFCNVSPDGSVTNPRITFATHVDFVLPALRALYKLRYTPRMQGDAPIPAEVEGVLRFDLIAGSATGALEANMISAPDGGPPSTDVEPLVLVDPITPYELLLGGEGGVATVTFSVDPNGAPTNVRLRDASNAEFGDALIAAIEMCSFSSPMNAGKSTTVALMRKVQFPVVAAHEDGGDDVRGRLLIDLRTGKIPGAAGLDGKLVPRYRVSPAYPEALKISGRPSGKAVIEFIIDREGRVRFPRIVSASDMRFGWSAATAVSQWVFDAPRRGGEPVDVRVQVPFQFNTPPG